jgi:ATP-binding cassette, subfamily B, bacterial
MRAAAAAYARETRRLWRLAVSGLLLPSVGSVLVYYVPPIVIAALIAHLGRPAPMVTLVPYLATFAGCWMLGEMLYRVGIHALIRMESQGQDRLYVAALDGLLERDAEFFANQLSGSLTKGVISYSEGYTRIADVLAFNILTTVVPALFACAVLATFSLWLPAVLLATIVVVGALVAPLIRRRQVIVDAREAAGAEVSGHVADVMGAATTVKAFAREPFESERHQANVTAYMRLAQRSWDFQNLRIDMLTSPLFVLANTAGIWLSLALAPPGRSAATSLVLVFSYYTRVTSFVWEFNSVYRSMETTLAAAAQHTRLLMSPPDILDPPDPVPLRVTRGAVDFSHVGFGWDSHLYAEPLLRDFCLHVAGGERVALVGRSGSGKSTLMRLLLRFRDVDTGRILVDGTDIAAVRQSELRHAIAYVPQDPNLFARSIRANLLYGCPGATDEQLRGAARLAHVSEFAEQLPNGYDTIVGERGVKLSGGQRQRIAIARALLKGAPILVLDEATSALDSESEALIQDSLWRLIERRTAIVIAHRLSTVQRMDRIVVLEDGRIVEEGAHAQLLDQEGVYARLWRRQSGGFLGDAAVQATSGSARP